MAQSAANDWELNHATITTLEKIGGGRSAEVFRGLLNEREVAVKLHSENFVRLRPEAQRAYERDIQIMKRISHPNLVNFVGIVSRCDRWDTIRFIYEFCAGGCLFELLHNCDHIELTFSQQLKMASDVACAMDFLHNFDPQIIHHNLSSLNLLLVRTISSLSDEAHVKVSDFGEKRLKEHFSTDDMSWGKRRIVGSAWHGTAPEVCTGGTITEKIDVFSYAMILFEVICREIPFEEEEPMVVPRLILSGARPDLEAVPPDCPAIVRDLMIACWAHMPEDRPSFKQCSEVLATMLVSRVVSLHLHNGGTRLSCMSLGGNELATIAISDADAQTFGVIRCEIVEKLSELGGQPRLVLPDGRLVDATSDNYTVTEVLGHSQ